jgi:hypothetical protein
VLVLENLAFLSHKKYWQFMCQNGGRETGGQKELAGHSREFELAWVRVAVKFFQECQ